MKTVRNPLKRFYGRRDLHFVTFSCYPRRPYLGSFRARNRFVKILDEVRVRHAFALIGYVVMPEHVHLSFRWQSLLFEFPLLPVPQLPFE